MAGVLTLGTISEILKEDYKPEIREQLASATALLKQMKKNTTKFDATGKRAFMALRTGRNTGIGARPERGTLPTAGQQGYTNAFFDVKYLYGSMDITGPSMAMTRNETGAYLSILDAEMRGLAKDLEKDQNRQLWHDGSSLLTMAVSDDGAKEITCVDTKFIQPGQKIGLCLFTTGATPEYLTVDAVTSATTFDVVETITSTTLSTWGIFLAESLTNASRDGASAATWAVPQEMWGLEAICSNADGLAAHGFSTAADSMFGKISRANTSFWDANVLVNGSNREVTQNLLQTAYDTSEIEGDAMPGLIMTSHGCKRSYAELLVSGKRYPPGGEITLDGGFKALEYNGVPMVAERDASMASGINNVAGQLGRFYFLTMGTLERHIAKDWQWMNEDGAVLSRVSGVDAYGGTMFSYQNIGCDRPNANTVLDDIIES